MIFTQWKQVLDGTKTQTRRIVKNGEMMARYWSHIHVKSALERPALTERVAWVVTPSKRSKWILDAKYAIVPKRGSCGIGYYTITAMRCEYLHLITLNDAILEGVASVDEYRDLWTKLNGRASWDANPLVWVISIHVVP